MQARNKLFVWSLVLDVVVLPREGRTFSCVHNACCLLSFREWNPGPVCMRTCVCVLAHVLVFFSCPEKILTLGNTLKQHRK